MGTRISEESHLKPKPMIEIGGRPILWHIMKIYAAHGITDFVICCGYKGYVIKEYFANYFLHMSDVTFHMAENRMEVHRQQAEPWKVTLVDTGETTMTGGRIKRVADYIDGTFCLTYGDGVRQCAHRRTSEAAQVKRSGGHRDGHSATGPVWRAEHHGRPGHQFPGKTPG